MTRLRDLIGREPKLGIRLPAWLERLVSIGIVSSDEQVVRRQRCVNVAALAMLATAGSHLIINSVHDFRGLFSVNVDNVLMVAVALLIPRLHRFGEHIGAITLLLMILFGHMFIVWSFGLASELQVYFTLAGAILFFFGVPNWRLFLAFFVAFLAALVVALKFAPPDGLVIPWDRDFRDLLSTQAMINTIVINAALLFYSLAALHRAESELQDQHERSEALIATVSTLSTFTLSNPRKSCAELVIKCEPAVTSIAKAATFTQRWRRTTCSSLDTIPTETRRSSQAGNRMPGLGSRPTRSRSRVIGMVR